MQARPVTDSQSLRRRVYDILEFTPRNVRVARLVNRAVGALIVASVAAVVLDTVPGLHATYGTVFHCVDALSLFVLSIEYGLRIWVAPEHVPSRQLQPWRARLEYVSSTQGLFDLAVVVPLWIAPFGFDELRILIVLRVLRILKFNRYSSGMSSLLSVLWQERRALGGCLTILLCATLVAASAMHVIEGRIQPDKFGTIPDAMWWAIVTLSTIGYGDVVPVTAAGKVVAAITIVGGLLMIALPVGIVANAFSEAIHKREFIVTWSMVARVPLFSRLTAGDIAHIMQLLKAAQVERDEVIIRHGETPHSMYFIAEGEVEVLLNAKHPPVILRAGHFFGERAVLQRRTRSATVRALVRTKLLVLEAGDLHGLIAREPAIAAHLNEVAVGRGMTPIIPEGTIGADEIARGSQADSYF